MSRKVSFKTIIYQVFNLFFVNRCTTCEVYLSGLVNSFLRVHLDLVAGMICDFGDGLFEDGRRLSDRQWRVQIRFTLEQASGHEHHKQHNTIHKTWSSQSLPCSDRDHSEAAAGSCSVCSLASSRCGNQRSWDPWSFPDIGPAVVYSETSSLLDYEGKKR